MKEIDQARYKAVALWLDGQKGDLSDDDLSLAQTVLGDEQSLGELLDVAPPLAVMENVRRRMEQAMAREAIVAAESRPSAPPPSVPALSPPQVQAQRHGPVGLAMPPARGAARPSTATRIVALAWRSRRPWFKAAASFAVAAAMLAAVLVLRWPTGLSGPQHGQQVASFAVPYGPVKPYRSYEDKQLDLVAADMDEVAAEMIAPPIPAALDVRMEAMHRAVDGFWNDTTAGDVPVEPAWTR